MGFKKGIAHILPVILIAIVVIGVWLLIYTFVLKKKVSLPGLSGKEPTVELKKDYKNPFNKNAQYVNPFDDFKNPLAQLQ